MAIKKSLAVACGGILALAATFSSSFAADMPQRAPAQVYKAAPAPADYFSGFFIGGELGYGWGRGKNSVQPNGLLDINTDGVALGGNLTYRWKVSPSGYLGIESSLDWVDLKNTIINQGSPVTGKQSWIGTTGLQFGGLVSPATLLYVSGGLAYGDIQGSIDVPASLLPGGYHSSIDKTRAGWFIGAGFDVAAAPNWTWGVQYKYVDLGKTSVCDGLQPLVCTSGTTHVTDNVLLLNLKAKIGGY